VTSPQLSSAEPKPPRWPLRGFPYLEPAKKMTEYWVFQDKSFNCIHRSNCSVRQGTLNPGRSEGTWHGAFPTYEKARRAAAVMSPQKGAHAAFATRETSKQREAPAVTQRMRLVRFDSRGKREPTRITRRG
jgi:hypothetical protein